eukprot:7859038-Pyramimonas_sp.AAC.1
MPSSGHKTNCAGVSWFARYHIACLFWFLAPKVSSRLVRRRFDAVTNGARASKSVEMQRRWQRCSDPGREEVVESGGNEDER